MAWKTPATYSDPGLQYHVELHLEVDPQMTFQASHDLATRTRFLIRDQLDWVRASMQCRAHRGNGESFTADVWFSTYKVGRIPILAAIVADITEKGAGAETEAVTGVPNAALSDFTPPTLNNRETEVLRFLVQGLANKE